MTQAIRTALEERLDRERRHREQRAEALAEDLMAIGRRCAARPVVDDRSEEEILGYDEHGVPGDGHRQLRDRCHSQARAGSTRRFALALARAPDRLMSAVSLVEASLVIEGRFGGGGARELDALIARSRIQIGAFDGEQAALAREAFRRFGRGRHPAGLNFSDCLAYALAKHLDEPLLFKGDDFAKTDVVPALTS